MQATPAAPREATAPKTDPADYARAPTDQTQPARYLAPYQYDFQKDPCADSRGNRKSPRGAGIRDAHTATPALVVV
eukprot:2725985-Pyramimonas_sp.AAC.1